MHESFEAPGAIATWANKSNHSVTYTRLYQGELFPSGTENFDFLIVMGGSQSPATTQADSPHFDAQSEISFIKLAIDDGKILLGVCLGAQMIGEALGAKFEHSPNREIGLYEVELTEEGKADSIFVSFPKRFMVGHWHGDMPGLLSDTKVLAKSVGCPRQIVRYTPKIYGFQCHFEFTPESIEGMIQNSGKELEENRNLPFVQRPIELRANNYAPSNELLFTFLDSII